MLPLWPTKRGWLALALALASFGVAMVNVSLVASVLSALMWAVIPASLLLALGSLRGVEVRRQSSPDGTVGHPISMPFAVVNRLRHYRQALLLIEKCPFVKSGEVVTPVPPLAPGETRTIPRRLMTVRRGEFSLDRVILRGGDPAGLFYRQRIYNLPRVVTIFPQRVSLQNVPLQLRHRVVASATGQSIGVSGVGQEFFGVRPYRPTDGMRVIHWKASARQRQLMVREFEENQIHQVSVMLDTRSAYTEGEDPETNLELLVKVAASLIDYLGGIYCRVLVAVPDPTGVQTRAGIGPETRQETLRLLAGLRAGRTDILDVFEQSIEQIPPSSVLYCLTLGDPAPLNGVFDQLLRMGVDIRCIWAPGEVYRKRPAAPPKSKTSAFGSVKPVMVGPHSDLAKVLSHA